MTDRRTGGRPGKNNMSPDPEGGRHDKDILKTITASSLRFGQLKEITW